jgi:ribonuclease Z
MEALVLGCGEAFDNDLFNTSILLQTGSANLLLDCGYSIPPRVWQTLPDPDAIDLVYISHPHADHYFGVPALLGRMWEDGRTRKLSILTQAPVIDQIRIAMELGYRGLSNRFKYEIEWIPALPERPVEACGAHFRFAETRHSVTNYAVRIESDGKSVGYSGDGMWTDASRRLFQGAHLVFHEAYSFETSPVHADIPSLLAMTPGQQIAQLALMHVQRDLRRHPDAIHEAIKSLTGCKALMPAPGQTLPL